MAAKTRWFPLAWQISNATIDCQLCFASRLFGELDFFGPLSLGGEMRSQQMTSAINAQLFMFDSTQARGHKDPGRWNLAVVLLRPHLAAIFLFLCDSDGKPLWQSLIQYARD